MGTDQDWTWQFSQRAADQFASLESQVQNRVAAKLDEIVDSDWREPPDFLEPLSGGPFSKLRVGEYRLACTVDHAVPAVVVHRIEHRSGAYTADD